MGSPVTITPDQPGVTISPDAPHEQPEPVKRFFSNLGGDLWNAFRGVVTMAAQPPQDDTERHIALAGPGALQVYRAGKGYVQAVQQSAERARASGEANDKTGVLINSAAAGLPLVGPMIGGIYEQAKSDTAGAAGTATSRVLQLASMAPEGSAIPNPASAAGRVAGRTLGAVTPDMAETASDLYRSSLKPSTTLSPAESAAVVKTALENKIPISDAGAAKLTSLIEDYNDAIEKTIQAGNKKGVTISPEKVATRADQAKARFANQVNPAADLSAIEASKQEFLASRGGSPAVPATPIPAAEAQALKRGTYQQLRGKYGELSSATIETQKALARGIKEELEVPFPELNNLNAQEGKLLALEPQLQRALGRTGNYEPLSMAGPITGAGVKVVTGSSSLGAAAAIMKTVLRDPMVRTRLAIALYHGSKGKLTYPAAVSRVGAYANALAQSSSAANAEPPESRTSE